MGAQFLEPDLGRLVGMAVGGAVRGMEGGADMPEIAGHEPCRFERHGDVVALAVVAHVGGQLDTGSGDREHRGLLGDPGLGTRPQIAGDPHQRTSIQRPEPLIDRLDEIAFEIGAGRAERAQTPREGWDQDRVDADLLGEQCRDQWPGAAERDHAEPRGIDPAPRQHVRGFRRHQRVGDADCAVGDGFHRQPKRPGQCFQRLARRRRLQRQFAAEPLSRREQPGDQKRVGQGRDARAGEAVAGRPGIGADAARPDLQGTGRVEPQDRAAADVLFAAQHRSTAADHADIG